MPVKFDVLPPRSRVSRFQITHLLPELHARIIGWRRGCLILVNRGEDAVPL